MVTTDFGVWEPFSLHVLGKEDSIKKTLVKFHSRVNFMRNGRLKALFPTKFLFAASLYSSRKVGSGA